MPPPWRQAWFWRRWHQRPSHSADGGRRFAFAMPQASLVRRDTGKIIAIATTSIPGSPSMNGTTPPMSPSPDQWSRYVPPAAYRTTEIHVKVNSDELAWRARNAKLMATPVLIANVPATMESAHAESVIRRRATRARAAASAVARRSIMCPKYWLRCRASLPSFGGQCVIPPRTRGPARLPVARSDHCFAPQPSYERQTSSRNVRIRSIAEVAAPSW